MRWVLSLFDMPASLGGQIIIVLGGMVSACILGGLIFKGVYNVVRYIQWINMTIIYMAKKTGTPLPQKLIDEYHKLPYNGTPVNHVLDADVPEPSGQYPLPPRPKKR